LFTPLAERNIIVDMIIQNASLENYTDLSFTVSRKDVREAAELVKAAARDIGAKDVEIDENVAKVSIIGVGMISHSGVASRMFAALARGDQYYDDQYSPKLRFPVLFSPNTRSLP